MSGRLDEVRQSGTLREQLIVLGLDASGLAARMGRCRSATEAEKLAWEIEEVAGRILDVAHEHTTPPDQDPSTTDTLRRAGVHLATQPLARPDRQRVSPVQEPSVVERIRRWLASVPIRITKHGVSRLDFEARRRGERR